MRLLNLKVQGYRSLRDIEWSPGRLNVLIGPNASGKSNLLSVLETLSVSARGTLGPHIIGEQGGMTALLFDGDGDELKIIAKNSPVDASMSDQKGSLTYELTLRRIGKTSAYRIEHELLGNYHRVEEGTSNQPFKLLERSPHRAVVFDEKEKRLQSQEEPTSEEESLLSESGGVLNPNRIVRSFKQELESWTICQGLHVGKNAPMRGASITRHETRIEADGQNLVSVLHSLYMGDREFRKDIESALTAAFGETFEELVFPPDAEQRIQLKIQWKHLRRARSAADLSDGTLRFLFLIAVLANPEPPSLIAIDEPELSLHPSMLPIVAEFAVDAATRTQVVFATHSPDFLDAFRDDLPVTTIVKLRNGETVLKTLQGEELQHWTRSYQSLGNFHRTGAAESIT